MPFEWKLIGDDLGGETPQNNTPTEPTPAVSAPVAQTPAEPQAAAPMTPAHQAPAPETVYAPAASDIAPAVDPSLPVCDIHNATVNSDEKVGYNGAYDAEVYSAYDTGVNADENSVVA